MYSLEDTERQFKLLGDPSRVRLLMLLAEQPLSVAELTEITGLGQSRVSTHLGKLRQGGLVRVTRRGASSYYAVNERETDADRIWRSFAKDLDDPLLSTDRTRAAEVLQQRQDGGSWASRIAGQMERHYSPGRTWETYARAFAQAAAWGDVLDVASGDGAPAELLAEVSDSVVCVDTDPKVVAAGTRRLARWPHVRFVHGDMHALPFDEAAFDRVFLLNALTHAQDPRKALAEASRVLRPGGRLIFSTLERHEHRELVADYDHQQPGFTIATLRSYLRKVGLKCLSLEVTHRELKAPGFAIIIGIGQKEEA